MSCDLAPSPKAADLFDEASEVREGAAGRTAMRTPADCWDCCVSPVIETRVLRQPQVCYQQPCHYSIPPMPCPWQCKQNVEECDPLCFDWHVDAPGPNDSYGLNGLNPHDWKMEGKYEEDADHKIVKNNYVPEHPAFSKRRADPNHPVYGLRCALPMECYSREPAARPCNSYPFAKDVNYFRDWRCVEAKAPNAWRPPYKQWATGRGA